MSNIPPCPVEAHSFLRLFGTLRLNPELREEDYHSWVALEIEARTGIGYDDIIDAMRRLAVGVPLAGRPERPEAGAYGIARKDLCYIAERLNELERTGRLNILWRKLCRKWPIFAEEARTFSNPTDDGDKPGATKKKQSTGKGDAEERLIAALTAHHKYGGIEGLNYEHIGNNELARKTGTATERPVDKASASAFFKKYFKGHSKYKSMCRDPKALNNALKLLNGEYPPHELAKVYDETTAIINDIRGK